MSKVTIGLKLSGDLMISVGDKNVLLNGSQKNLVQIENGHGITENVDKDFWEAWLQENKESKLVKGGYIFANEKTVEVKAEAKDKKDNKSGTEKLNPKEEKGIETVPKQK